MADKHHLLVERLAFLLGYAEKAYEHYFTNGKKFVFASILYSVNEKIRCLLFDEILSLPAEKRRDAMELIFHIEVWQGIWSDERSRKQPGWSDEFTFDNEINFPKESVARLLEV